MPIFTGAIKITRVSFKSTSSVRYYSSVKFNKDRDNNITSETLNNLLANQGVTITEDNLIN